MKRGKKIVIVSSIVLNLVFLYTTFSTSENINRTAYWHPFELNSNINLESIVNDGYRYSSAPCGFVQYTKQIADTIIQYEVYVDCKTYEGVYEPILFEIEDEPTELSESETNDTEITWEEEIAKNKYYPWKFNEVKDCYQGINWRIYTVNLGESLDLNKVRDFIHKKGGRIIMENWSDDKGGSVIVYYRENALYFCVNVSKEKIEKNNGSWVLGITRTIPHLDYLKERQSIDRQKKMDKYYNWEAHYNFLKN
ncbi:hypothetical protein SAMN04489761_1060 [Tenacibaculum sp. MAR_2009_124]|uniref:hypothetical protein n=1 Tax=Tenacibaculum sp. MAR_2009_124 TaxID=1250059 RepID=UPI00089ACD97|nr:hypothetical protein [Tenacibaculum sp. MAR_2009_124]SEB49891.1 hypothetical protein SAMN04489761_1060 [Tenacibaculum sp. MAR_2009_124]